MSYFDRTKIVGASGDIAEVNSDNQLHTVQRGKSDLNNATATPLGIAGVFTGTGTDILDFGAIGIMVYTDADGTLAVQFSPDNSTWYDGESYDIIGGSTKFFTPPTQGAYFRIVYTNGAVAQTVFCICTTLKKQAIKWSSHNIDVAITDQDDAMLTKAVITGKKTSGAYDNVSLTNGGNMKISLEEFENGVSVNSNSQLKVTLHDLSGNVIDSHLGADGGYHMGTALIQAITTSTANSTTTNLAAAATFTGTAQETLGINGIQMFHYADQDCTIYIDQSLDGTNWDLTDSRFCLANEACSAVYRSDAPYYRMRVTNDGTATTTTIRTATGMTPIINPLPRALTDDDRLKTESTLIGRENTERHVWVTPSNALKTHGDVRLVGTNFDGTTKDTNFWTETVTGSGSVTQSGEIQLDTGTTANSTAKYESVRTARFVVGSALNFQGIFKFVTAGTTDNVRRCGAYNSTDGFFFQLDGTTFSVGYRKASSDTLVSSGSFNGNYGPSYTMDTSYHKLAIEWTPRGVFFYVDGKLLHKDNQGHRSNSLSLPITFENVNDNGNIVDVSFDCISVAIVRLGKLVTNGTYKYLGANATTICKYSPGTLQRIVNLDNAGTVSVYDDVAATPGTEIAIIDTAKALGTLEFNAPFSTGLTVVVASGAKITVIYE